MLRHRLAITLIFSIISAFTSLLQAAESPVHTELAISFNIEESLLLGTAKITVPAGEPLHLNLSGLEITGSTLNAPGKENQLLTFQNQSDFFLRKLDTDRILYISYKKHVKQSFRNIISKEAIILTSGWLPIPARKTVYTLTADVPPGFTAISESDIFPETDPDGRARFHFSQPVHTITFAAAPYIKKSKEVREGLYVHTLFFQEELYLAQGYLDAAVAYIKRYETEIGRFPYAHYLIVENTMPTGFGIPTFTLLGRQVIRLPFIKNISLGHEILHSWFGNSIEPDFNSGNWSEGLTTYLADMAYRHDAGDGALARKEKIQEYHSYVTDSTPTLDHFISAGHNNPAGRAERAVGYGKSAMLFHELENRVGTTLFGQTLRLFYNQFKGRSASWTDIQHLFEKESNLDLGSFFRSRLEQSDLPDIALANVRAHNNSENTQLTFTLEQKSSKPYEFLLPFTVQTINGETQFTQLITEEHTEITRPVDSQPLELIVDPKYNVMRALSEQEQYPSWSKIMEEKDVLVILSDENQKLIYSPFIKYASRLSWETVSATQITEKEINGKNLIFLGAGSLYRGLYGLPDHNESGFTLDVRTHPIDTDTTVALISSSDTAETAAVVSRLSHYGKYSYLYFKKGVINQRYITPSDSGIHIPIESTPHGFTLSQMSDFNTLVTELAKNRVIYLGENHTSRSDHILQRMLIEALYKQDPNIAIGMEMFPRSSQGALDDYILHARTDETTFIKESHYYDVWRFDYRLFRPIFTFARNNHIPVIGLNLDREIVSSVYKKGGIANLDPGIKTELPIDRKLDLPGYTKRLKNIHAMHGKIDNAHGALTGFIESQALWDEFMAESISDYLRQNPTRRLIVLAGSQHTRKDSGIPPRVARRKKVSQTTVINMATSNISGKNLAETTDLIFFHQSSEFPPQGKIGVVLKTMADISVPGLEIIEINPSSHSKSSGLRVKDILTQINGHQVRDMDDVRIAMLDKSIGEKVSIMVKREQKINNWQEHTFEVELSDPNAQMAHP